MGRRYTSFSGHCYSFCRFGHQGFSLFFASSFIPIHSFLLYEADMHLGSWPLFSFLYINLRFRGLGWDGKSFIWSFLSFPLAFLFLYMVFALCLAFGHYHTLYSLSLFFKTRLFQHQSPIYLSPCVIAYWLRKAFEWLSGCVWDKVGGQGVCL